MSWLAAVASPINFSEVRIIISLNGQSRWKLGSCVRGNRHACNLQSTDAVAKRVALLQGLLPALKIGSSGALGKDEVVFQGVYQGLLLSDAAL